MPDDSRHEVTCAICGKPVSLEQRDENGAPVHEECYLLKTRRESWLRTHWE
jgi:hypothetical protein